MREHPAHRVYAWRATCHADATEQGLPWHSPNEKKQECPSIDTSSLSMRGPQCTRRCPVHPMLSLITSKTTFMFFVLPPATVSFGLALRLLDRLHDVAWCRGGTLGRGGPRCHFAEADGFLRQGDECTHQAWIPKEILDKAVDQEQSTCIVTPRVVIHSSALRQTCGPRVGHHASSWYADANTSPNADP